MPYLCTSSQHTAHLNLHNFISIICLLYINKAGEKKERKTQIMPPTGTIHENQVHMSFGHVAFITVIHFCQKRNHPPISQASAALFLSVGFLPKIPPHASALGGASSRCDSSVKSIWDFQWTLERVALISGDYTSWAVTCQSPSAQCSGPAPRSSSPAPVSGDPAPVAEGPVIHPACWYPPPVGPNLPTKTSRPWARRTLGLLLRFRRCALTPARASSHSQNSP